VSSEQQQALTQSALRGWALGEADFVAELQKKTARRVIKALAGRPLASKP
jgi:putative transposase